jgi:xylulokinase
MKYLMGADFGGGSSKVTLIDEEGRIIASAVEEYPMLYPQNGWAEQNMDDLYLAFIRNIKKILEISRVDPRDIAALSLDGGTHIAVLLDENNSVIRPAIYWSDSRSVEEVAELSAIKDELMELSYNYPGPLWTLPQLMWVRRHEPENFRRITKIIFLKDYIRYRLTGNIATDSIEVMGAMFRDERKNDWSDKLLSICGLTREQMPEVLEPTDIAGTPLPQICKETGLSPDTLIAVGATDTVMEVFASGNIKAGNTTIKLATAGRICPVTDKAYPHPQLVCYRHVVPGLWYPGTATKTCAQSMRWYRDVFGKFEILESQQQGTNAYTLISNEAASIPAGSDNLFFHPYLQGELTPYQNTKLKASFTGVSSYHTKAHFNRAVMEGVAYSLRDCMNVLRQLKIPMDETLKIIGGGSKSSVWRQIVSDVLNVPLVRVTTDDSSIGSAMLAGVASGVFSSFRESVEICSKTSELVYPIRENVKVYEEGFKVYKEIQSALEGIYNRL